MRLAFGDRMFFAPVGKKGVEWMLDAGTATGTADKYPDAEVFPPNHFDLIPTGTMVGSIRDWPFFSHNLLSRCAGVATSKPIKSTLMLVPTATHLPENSTVTARCLKQEPAVQKAADRITGENFEAQTEEARSVVVVDERFNILIEQWPMDKALREAGAFYLVAMLEGIKRAAMTLWTRLFGVG
ncbi:MAG: hypothetical protein Q9184_005475 [Pyrenodesmia sp. 2 TL-2023]